MFGPYPRRWRAQERRLGATLRLTEGGTLGSHRAGTKPARVAGAVRAPGRGRACALARSQSVGWRLEGSGTAARALRAAAPAAPAEPATGLVRTFAEAKRQAPSAAPVSSRRRAELRRHDTLRCSPRRWPRRTRARQRARGAPSATAGRETLAVTTRPKPSL